MVVQSPLEYPATLTPMEPRAVLAIVDAIAEAGVILAGVNGDAATAASFAGQWSERCKSAATPFQGTRLYELFELGEVPHTVGHLRQAARDGQVSEIPCDVTQVVAHRDPANILRSSVGATVVRSIRMAPPGPTKWPGMRRQTSPLVSNRMLFVVGVYKSVADNVSE